MSTPNTPAPGDQGYQTKPYFCCLICSRELNVLDDSPDDQHSTVSGLFVRAFGNYGSNYYDPSPMVQEKKEHLEAVICNGCVRKNQSKFRVKDEGKLKPWVILPEHMHRTEEEEAAEDYAKPPRLFCKTCGHPRECHRYNTGACTGRLHDDDPICDCQDFVVEPAASELICATCGHKQAMHSLLGDDCLGDVDIGDIMGCCSCTGFAELPVHEVSLYKASLTPVLDARRRCPSCKCFAVTQKSVNLYACSDCDLKWSVKLVD